MQARDVMTSPVITLRPDTPVRAAAALLISHGFTASPVVDADGRLLGIVTEADLMRGRIVREGGAVTDAPEPAVAAVMSGDPVTAGPGDDLADVVATMLEHGFRSLPVVRGTDLVGILSRRDVLRCVARGELTSADVAARRRVGPDR
ncbi:CBS domain-containing protein [Pseudonocardia hydrocarbonoxydans]|uniref:CBS domain-containing protein n=1 Tax=Pseudonocardia hydrocarbonoxydans TaxID=76726 RepID=A0A4Y3WRS5_9PSEU|nr:CBS domain-containing protein [Pseudonocardia hydrocarbonoxydans]GEC20066.1 hypothetical protein PHY01_23490 [Pseudonocardia hydrocarbonoxydans]